MRKLFFGSFFAVVLMIPLVVSPGRVWAQSGTLLGAPQPGTGNTVVFHIQHHWVTETGDTLFFDPATATTVPLSQTLFAIVTYPVHLTGGTGKFAGSDWRPDRHRRSRFGQRDGISLQRTSLLRRTRWRLIHLA